MRAKNILFTNIKTQVNAVAEERRLELGHLKREIAALREKNPEDKRIVVLELRAKFVREKLEPVQGKGNTILRDLRKQMFERRPSRS
jgi:hypothetical protein